MRPSDSPYLSSDERLADVIAAIQAMGTYKFYKLDFKAWADRISGDETQADHWRLIFEQHPEFFRLDSPRQRASLVWRRQRQKLYDVDADQNIPKAQLQNLSADQRQRLSRMPLKSDELAMLISTAINLHARALEHKQDSRWKISAGLGFLGAVAGGVVAAVISAVAQ